MSKTVPVVATVVVAILAGVVYTIVRSSDTNLNAPASADSELQITESLKIDATNTAVENAAKTDPQVDLSLEPSDALANAAEGNEQSENDTRVANTETLNFAQGLARNYTNDQTLLKNAEALENDPALLAAVVDEFLAETDEERLGRLRLLLGQLDDPSLVDAAETMVFSGNAVSADAGLDLLRDISADVPAARTVALDVLSSTQDPELLIGAANVMAKKGANDAEISQQVVTSMSSLVQHPDARVRRTSYSMLASWSDDPSVTPTLLQGLTDDDPAVRRSTAYGLVGYKHVDTSVIDALLRTAENSSDPRRGRRAAILALQGMPLDDAQSARLQSVKNNLN